MAKKNVGCCVFLAVLSIFLLIVGLVAVVVVPSVVHQKIRDLLPISSPSSIVFKAWQDTDADALHVERNFYMFNLTNPYDVYNWHAVPNFEPVGPFVFHEHTYNPLDNISWNVHAKVDFNYFTDMRFDPTKSIDAKTGKTLTLDTHIVTPNMPFFGGMWRLSRLFTTLRDTHSPFATAAGQALCPALNNSVGDNIVADTGIFTKRPVEELLHGYVDPLWTIMHEMAGLVKYNVPTTFRSVFNHSQPAPSPWSFRYGQMCPMWDDRSICNSSGSNSNSVFSGASWKLASQVDVGGTVEEATPEKVGSFSQLSEYSTWAGNEEMWWWGDDANGTCRKFEGSNGMMFPAGLNKDSKPFVYFDALFRKLQLEFREESTNHGLPTLRFGLDKNGQKAGPHTKCYNQMYDDLMNLTAAMFAPAYISKPFFHDLETTQPNREVTDRTIPLANITIEGLPVDKWKVKHSGRANLETMLDIEPLTGTLMEAHARIQFNTFMHDVDIPAPAPGKCENMYPGLKPKTVKNPHTGVVTENSKFPHTLFPFFYLDRHAIMPQDIADQLHSKVVLPLALSKYVGWALVVVSIVLFNLGAVCIFIRRKHSPEEEYLTSGSLSSSPHVNSATKV